MENDSLFPFKYRLRKTDEPVEIVAWGTVEKGARNENDWVSYIDASGAEHVKDHLTLEWDFVIESPFDSLTSKWESTKLPELREFDVWEARRYELVKEMFLSDKFMGSIDDFVKTADKIIEALTNKQE